MKIVNALIVLGFILPQFLFSQNFEPSLRSHWANHIYRDPPTDGAIDAAMDIAAQGSDSIFASGWFSGTARFGGNCSGSAPGTGSTESYSAYISKYNQTTGNCDWVRYGIIQGTTRGDAYSLSVSVFSNTSAFLVGDVQAPNFSIGPRSDNSFLPVSGINNSARNAFVAKFRLDTIGNRVGEVAGDVVWVAKITSPGSVVGKASAVTSNGEIVVAGDYSNTLNCGSLTTGSGTTGLYIARFTNNGSCNLLKNFPISSGGTAILWDIAIDETNNIYVAASFQGTLTIGSSSVVAAAATFSGMIAKFNSFGTLQWIRRTTPANTVVGQGVAGIGASIKGVAISRAGDVYVSANFNGQSNSTKNFSFSPAASITDAEVAPIFATGATEGVVAKFTSNGSLQWMSQIATDSLLNLEKITVDPVGNSTVTGLFRVSARMPSAGITLNAPDTYRTTDSSVLVAQINKDGVGRWMRRISPFPSDSRNGGKSIVVLPDYRIAFTASTYGSYSLDNFSTFYSPESPATVDGLVTVMGSPLTPELRMSIDGDNAKLSWSAVDGAGYSLYSTSDFNSPYQLVNLPIVETDGVNEVVIPSELAHEFFRLKQY